MTRFLTGLVLVLFIVLPAQAEDIPGKVLREAWYECRTDQGKIGFIHLLAREMNRDGRKLIHTSLREEINYLRSGDPYSDSQEQATLETPAGEVVELVYSITLSKRQKLRLHGTRDGADMLFRVLSDKGEPTGFTQRIPWDPSAVGLYALDRFFEGKKIERDAVHTVKAFQVYANRVVPITYTFEGLEWTRVGKEERQLFRVEQSYPKEVYLTPTSLWLDSDGQIVKMEEEDSTLFGKLSREQSTQATATARFKPKVRDKDAPVLANRPITVKRGKPTELVVRVSVVGETNPGTLFEQDGRQTVVSADAKAVELRLLAKVPPPMGQPQPAPAEYLESNFFIRSDDALVQKFAKEAVGKATDPHDQMKQIRRWFGRKFRGNYEIAFATADEVARTLEGDCTEMGILAAAMCRALDIPSRVAFGLVYDSDNQGFGGHLWTEVYLDGQWEPLDTTGVLDSLNAAYLRVASYSMKDVLNPDELVAVRRAFAGQMKVDVVEAK